MNYTKINMDTWARRDVFRHFIADVRCVISITTELDVTDVVAFCKANDYRMYPTMLYLTAQAINSRDAFKLRYDEAGDLILWQEVSPSYPVFHPEDELFTRLITEYSPDFHVFYQRVLADMALHQDKRAFEVAYTAQNTFDASSVPWLQYTACDLHVFDSGTYLAPVVTWGKHDEKNGRLMMPLTMQVHHAVADGFHIARFFEDMQREIQTLTK
ncbi:chloramphenicol acetyltransferase [Eubacteriales bacterium OttesenSCG-928-K08]|nr:chloramphenicol acetyltransferase [Eubacteriales bacterium OttesenSCG-928-K08]